MAAMKPIRLFAGATEIDFELLCLPGGEPHMGLSRLAEIGHPLTIVVRLANGNAVVALLVVVDAMRRNYWPERLGYRRGKVGLRPIG